MTNPVPAYTFPAAESVIVSASKRIINKTATPISNIQATTAAEGQAIRICYGECSMGAQIAFIKSVGSYIYVLAVWCLGEIDSYVSIKFDGVAQPGWIVANYNGTTTQTANPTLISIEPTYSDDLIITKGAVSQGVAYSVFKIPATSFPNSITATLRGKLVYDPRIALTAYSDNPSLCLADYIGSPLYGQNKTVLSSSITDAANENDTLVGGLKRRTLNLVIDKQAKTGTHIEALRTYAGCIVVGETSGVKLVPNRPVTVTRATIDKIVNGSLKLNKIGDMNSPTVVNIEYTDTSVTPWKVATATAKLPGVDSGSELFIESTVRLPGITTYAQAYREAIERLNELTITDLSIDFVTFDESLQDEVGDVVPVTHPIGLTDKLFRIMSCNPASPGRWKISAKEYDPLVYSDSVQAEPSTPDTTLPSLFEPLPPTSVASAEEIYQQIAQGTYSSRLRIAWAAPDYPYIQSYRVVVKVAGDIVFESNTINTEIVTSSVMELEQHSIEVYTFSGLVYSSAATNTVTPKGKYLPPNDITTLTGFEAGGIVFLSWNEVYDVDMFQYEIRYGSSGVTWADATLLDRVDALTYSTKTISEGAKDFLIKALDSVGNYSTNEDMVSLTVTLDSESFLIDQKDLVAPVTETLLYKYKSNRYSTSDHWITNSGESWALLFGAAAMSTYVNPLASYQAAQVSEWLSETWDLTQEISGNWAATLSLTTISGTIEQYLELSTDDVTYVQYSDLNEKTSARYARVRAKTNTGLMLIDVPDAYIKMNAIPRVETGQSISNITGADTITLKGKYFKAKVIAVSPIGSGTATLTGISDNPALSLTIDNTFDAYVMDNSNAKTATNYYWRFEGV